MRELLAFWVAVLVLAATVAANAAPLECGPCDVNGDGETSKPGDYIMVLRQLGSKAGSPGWIPAADLNGDGVVSMTDYQLLLKFCPMH